MTTDTEALTYDDIAALALAHGFKLKPQVDGRMALNDYVIDFARAVYDIGHAAAKAETAAPVVGRWYFVTNDGAATLCVDEADARESAAEADIAFPRMAPHRAVQLVPADQLAAAGEPVAWAHFAKNGNIRLWAPERPLDLDGNAAQPLYTADQLAAAVAAERGKCAVIVNELRMECARRNMPESATMLWHAEDAIRAGAKETSDADQA